MMTFGPTGLAVVCRPDIPHQGGERQEGLRPRGETALNTSFTKRGIKKRGRKKGERRSLYDTREGTGAALDQRFPIARLGSGGLKASFGRRKFHA